MRVLRVIDSLDPRIGGPPVVSLNSAISVARGGVRCDIAAVVRPGDVEAPWWQAAAQRCHDEGIGLIGFPVLAPSLSPRHYDPSAALVRWLVRHDRTRYDIVHADGPWTGACAIASTVAALGGTQLVLTPHEVFTPFDLTRGGVGIRLAKHAGAQAYAKVSDLIVCSSPLEMRDAERAGIPRHRLTWIYHPVIDDGDPVDVRPPAHNPTGLRVGYLGRLHPKKNVHLLIDAVGALDERVSLVVAGRGDLDLESELRRQAELLLPGRCEFVGWVSVDDKRRFLSTLDVLVVPSEYECFGVVAIEALAVGTPVIASSRVGVADIVQAEHVGQVVCATVGAISEALRRYLHDPLARQGDASRGRSAAVRNASFAAHGVRLASEYARILSKARPT